MTSRKKKAKKKHKALVKVRDRCLSGLDCGDGQQDRDGGGEVGGGAHLYVEGVRRQSRRRRLRGSVLARVWVLAVAQQKTAMG